MAVLNLFVERSTFKGYPRRLEKSIVNMILQGIKVVYYANM